jgi:hypothetical protein
MVIDAQEVSAAAIVRGSRGPLFKSREPNYVRMTPLGRPSWGGHAEFPQILGLRAIMDITAPGAP